MIIAYLRNFVNSHNNTHIREMYRLSYTFFSNTLHVLKLASTTIGTNNLNLLICRTFHNSNLLAGIMNIYKKLLQSPLYSVTD